MGLAPRKATFLHPQPVPLGLQKGMLQVLVPQALVPWPMRHRNHQGKLLAGQDCSDDPFVHHQSWDRPEGSMGLAQWF